MVSLRLLVFVDLDCRVVTNQPPEVIYGACVAASSFTHQYDKNVLVLWAK